VTEVQQTWVGVLFTFDSLQGSLAAPLFYRHSFPRKASRGDASFTAGQMTTNGLVLADRYIMQDAVPGKGLLGFSCITCAVVQALRHD
jgi:hypothetical protein